jgi:diguanylate cyclase (GGDEF)-like protein
MSNMPAALLRGCAGAAVPGDEGQRLHTLAAYGLASTPSEADFDNFASMAADLFKLPIGLINLVGERHLTVKGRSGLQVESIPRDGAFCTYTILSDNVFVVPDLAADTRFAGHPLVTELGFRFYAGAPLVSPLNGHRIGTLCIVDRVPHPALDERGMRLLSGLAALVMDRMELRRAEHRLRYLAHNDPLTGCANRAKLGELTEAVKAEARPAAMVLLDLDSFKHVNDTLGHAAGDALLVEVGRRLTAALDGRGTLGRLGGDEFAALLPGFGDAAAACGLAHALQKSLDPPFLIAGREFRVGASAGVAVAPPAEVGHLLASADLALYHAKTEGRRQCRMFEMAMREKYIARRALEEEVSRAARDGEFELHFQPQICLKRKVLIGAEALLRWRHPERGLLPPNVFLDALEAGAMAGAVGDWVVEEGCRQAALWRRQGLELRIGVNLFAEQIRAGNLEATVRAALERWALPASALELELTETIALRHDDELLAPLHALHAHGVGVALDDFGTGFASLSMLRRCPLSRLKIDRGFVSELGMKGDLGSGSDRSDVVIVEAVLALGRGLGLGVVAEGVETEAQAAFLAAHGCNEAQGYLYGRPAPASRMLAAAPGQSRHFRADQTAPSGAAPDAARASRPPAAPSSRYVRRRRTHAS